MKTKSLLIRFILAISLLGIGVVISQPTKVNAGIFDTILPVGIVDHKVNISLASYDAGDAIEVTFSTNDINPNFISEWGYPKKVITLLSDIVNVKTGKIVTKGTGAAYADLTSYISKKSAIDYSISENSIFNNFSDGEYRYVVYERDTYIDPETKLQHRYRGESPIFKIKNRKFDGLVNTQKIDEVYKQSNKTPKSSEKLNQSNSSIKTGWYGNSYYRMGSKVMNQWIFDVRYNSYFYLNIYGDLVQNAWIGNYYLKSDGKMAKSEWIYDYSYQAWYYLKSNGSYARNAWQGNYYLKSDGKMAKSEWIYDSSYQAWYYLKSDGSYARNAWQGNYYLKSDGKMAKNERVDGGRYYVDASGLWKP